MDISKKQLQSLADFWTVFANPKFVYETQDEVKEKKDGREFWRCESGPSSRLIRCAEALRRVSRKLARDGGEEGVDVDAGQ